MRYKNSVQVIRSNISAAGNAVAEIAGADCELDSDCWTPEQAAKLNKHVEDNKKILIEKLEAALEVARGIR